VNSGLCLRVSAACCLGQTEAVIIYSQGFAGETQKHEGAREADRVEAAATAKDTDAAPPFESLPRVRQQRDFLASLDRLGYIRPYFLLHEGRAGASTVIDGRRLINFSSNDYLGFNQHPEVRRAAKEAIDRFGLSPSASRLVAGEREPHRRLEKTMARHYNHDASLSFVSGYGTNVSVVGALMAPGDLIVFDSLAHNSIIAGARLSRAKVRSFPHNDYDALD
jgi:7-keto-8-aminopelargonate synthetase-like enzyme